MTLDKLTKLLVKYRSTGFVKGSEFLLPLNDAISLVDDLENLEIAIMGLSGWYYANPEKKWIAEDMDVDFFVGDEILQSENKVIESTAAIRRFLREPLPSRTIYISFTLDIPPKQWKEVYENVRNNLK